MSGNVIRSNNVGLFLESGEAMSIHGNDVYGNASYEFECSPWSCKPFDLDAAMDWWGATDYHAIADAIRDCTDEPTISCCIVFEPWCTSPGCEPTVVSAGAGSARRRCAIQESCADDDTRVTGREP
jgi:hypothetical protein